MILRLCVLTGNATMNLTLNWALPSYEIFENNSWHPCRYDRACARRRSGRGDGRSVLTDYKFVATGRQHSEGIDRGAGSAGGRPQDASVVSHFATHDRTESTFFRAGTINFDTSTAHELSEQLKYDNGLRAERTADPNRGRSKLHQCRWRQSSKRIYRDTRGLRAWCAVYGGLSKSYHYLRERPLDGEWLSTGRQTVPEQNSLNDQTMNKEAPGVRR